MIKNRKKRKLATAAADAPENSDTDAEAEEAVVAEVDTDLTQNVENIQMAITYGKIAN